MTTPAELVGLGLSFYKLAGRPPSRDDFSLASRIEQTELLLGVRPPPISQFRKHFRSWTEYLDACGLDQAVGESGGRTLQAIERAAEVHCEKLLGVTLETAERSITDGWYPDGRAVEIKGSVLRKHSGSGKHFFGFRVHGRELSVSADELILVGLSRDLTPIVRLQIPKASLTHVVDGKSNVTVYAEAIWGQGKSQYRRFIRWHERVSFAEAIAQFSAGAP